MGVDYERFPPTGIQGSTLSWLYCALMSEARGLGQYPYTRVPEFAQFVFTDAGLGGHSSFPLSQVWRSWVDLFRGAMEAVGVGAPTMLAGTGLPYWSDVVQDAVVAEISRGSSDFTVQLQALCMALGLQGAAAPPAAIVLPRPAPARRAPRWER